MHQLAPASLAGKNTATPPVSLVNELLAYGVISQMELARRLVEFEEVSMSHSAYRVSVAGEIRAFIKRSNPVRSQGRNLHAEAFLYRLASIEPALNGIVPACQFVSDDDSLIVLESIPESPRNAQWVMSGPVLDGTAGHAVLAAYGQAVARVHSVKPPPFGEAPWLLLAFEFDWGGNQQLPSPVRHLFNELTLRPIFHRGFRDAWTLWEATSLIHGDLRWTNVLYANPGAPHVRLVDWELSCLGDPAWDVGSVLADILSSFSLALRQTLTMQQFFNTALPFLHAYHSTAQLDASGGYALLYRSILNAGVRLVQAVSEYGHINGAEMLKAKQLLLPWSVTLFREAEQIATELDRSIAP